MPFGPHTHAWSDEDRQTVMDMLDQHVSAAIIAEEFGITRNAAIGRIARDKELHAHLKHVHRKPKKIKPMRLPINPDARAVDLAMALVSFIAAKRGKQPQQPQPPRPRKPAMRLMPLMDTGSLYCKWPVKDDPAVIGGILCCGAGTAFGESYCAWHAEMARPGGRQ
jgi:hypothetical protein